MRAVTGARSEALAQRFEAKAREAMATLERLGDADWRKVTEAEKWPVGVTAHHLAGVLVPISYVIKAVAAGQPLDGFGLDRIDEMNARHAQEFADCTGAETAELLRLGMAAAAAAIRELSDAELDRTGVLAPSMPPMSAEQIVTSGLLDHIDEHFDSIRRTVGH